MVFKVSAEKLFAGRSCFTVKKSSLLIIFKTTEKKNGVYKTYFLGKGKSVREELNLHHLPTFDEILDDVKNSITVSENSF